MGFSAGWPVNGTSGVSVSEAGELGGVLFAGVVGGEAGVEPTSFVLPVGLGLAGSEVSEALRAAAKVLR